MIFIDFIFLNEYNMLYTFSWLYMILPMVNNEYKNKLLSKPILYL